MTLVKMPDGQVKDLPAASNAEKLTHKARLQSEIDASNAIIIDYQKMITIENNKKTAFTTELNALGV